MSFGRITQSSVLSCNVSYREEISAETLVAILSGKIAPTDWIPYLDVFFNELPERYIHGVMEENNLSVSQLLTVFSAMPKAFQGKNFMRISHND